MENASKALLIAGAILLCILIIAIGMFIYNSASSTITDSMSTLSTQEVDAFNNQFTSYEGKQTGSNVKALIGRLIGNANTYRDEPAKVPQVFVDAVKNNAEGENEVEVNATFTVDESGDPSEYISVLGKIRNRLETKHEYYVEISYQGNGLIDYITVSYNPEEIEEAHSRDAAAE